MTSVSPVIFWLLALVVIGAALAVVLGKNIVHSALYLALCFAGVAGVYMTMEMDFLAFVQLLVYVGAIAIMLIFGVMLTRRGDIRESNLFNGQKLVGALVAAVLFLLVGSILVRQPWNLAAGQTMESTVGPIAEAMLGPFLVPFEAAALLLLVAMVGAILIARGVRENK